MSRAPRPAGVAPGVQQRVPERAGRLRRAHDLDPVLARVARPADERLAAGGQGERRGVHPRRQLALEQRRGHDRPGVRALDREHRPVGERVADLGVEAVGVLAEPGEVPLVVGGVGDGQVALVAEPVGEEVVEDAAVLAAEHRVLGAADLELGDVVGEQPLEQVERAGPLGLDLAHVGDVEDAAGLADGEVLLAARPRTAPASPSRRTGRASRRRRRARRTARFSSAPPCDRRG